MGPQEDAPSTHIHVVYTDMGNRLISNNVSGRWSIDDIHALRSSDRESKTPLWRLFVPHYDIGINILNFHVLDHLVDHLERLWTVSVLSASP